jgi:ADP-heptose:LPS heptosyltransferase
MATETRETDVLFHIQSDGIGDTLAATPVIRYFCKQFGNRKVDVWTARPEVFMRNPWVAKIHTLTNPQVDFFQQWHRMNIKQTFIRGDKPEGKVRHYHTPLVDYCSINALACIIPSSEKHFEFVISNEAKIFVKGLLAERDVSPKTPIVVLHPSDTWKTRRMPKETWEAICLGLVKNKIVPVIVGKSTQDREPLRLGDIPGVVDLVEKTTLEQTIALMDIAKAVITLDAGSICMAGCTDTPIVGIFTVNPPEFRSPYRNGRYDYKLWVANETPSCIYCGPQLWRLDNNLSNCLNAIYGDQSKVMCCLPNAEKVVQVTLEAVKHA